MLSGVKAPLRLLPLVIPYSGTLLYDMALVSALRFLQKYMSILLPPFVTPFGVAVRGKSTFKMLALVSPYSESLRYAMTVILNLVLLHKYMSILLPPFYPFEVPIRGKATFEMLTLVIPYSDNTIGCAMTLLFSFGALA